MPPRLNYASVYDYESMGPHMTPYVQFGHVSLAEL